MRAGYRWACVLLLAAVAGAAFGADAPNEALTISDCCCDTRTVDSANDRELHQLLQALRRTFFFKIFKVNLYSECPFWKDGMHCTRRSCAVCECEENEIPEPWRMEKTDLVDRTMHSQFRRWDEPNEDVWIVQDSSEHMSFINLELNPESYTGFEGNDAWKVWSAIYKENCFVGSMDRMCFEERVFYRLISGLHSCISAHTAANFPIGELKFFPDALTVEGTRGAWGVERSLDPASALDGPSFEIFEQKLGRFPDRVDNLYFALVVMLRAVNKASDLLLNFNYDSGHPEEDTRAREGIERLLQQTLVHECSPAKSFDETLMFSSPDKAPLLRQFRTKFLNISRIMDCVGCEKCRVHGKLQILGLGTALKILFTGKGEEKLKVGELTLQRNEIVALINTLGKFSNAVQIVHAMRRVAFVHRLRFYLYIFLFALFVLTAAFVVVRRIRARARKPKST
jgi:ERO1-like protein alpha